VTQYQQSKNKFLNFITVDFNDLGAASAMVNQLKVSNSGNENGGEDNSSGDVSDNTDRKIMQLQNSGQITIKANASLNLKG
jgi:hypothetical protein